MDNTGPGRPLTHPHTPSPFTFRVTPDEAHELRLRVANSGLTVSEYVRETLGLRTTNGHPGTSALPYRQQPDTAAETRNRLDDLDRRLTELERLANPY